MYKLEVPPKSHPFPSKDDAFRVSFSAPLAKRPPRLSREGYIRALEVYGREDILLNCLRSSVNHFNEWRAQNPGDLDLYRRHANSLGYDWERGSVTEDGIYLSYVAPTAAGAPPAYDPANSSFDHNSPEYPRDIRQFIHIDEKAGEENMAREPKGSFAAVKREQADTPDRSRALRNRNHTVEFQTPGSSSRFPILVSDLPVVLQGAPGNLRFVPGEEWKNAQGAASLLNITTNILRVIVDDLDGITADDLAEIKGMLDYIGTKEDVEKYEKSFRANLAPSRQSRFAIYSQPSLTPSTQGKGL